MCFLPLLAFCVTAYVSFRGHAVTVGIFPYRFCSERPFLSFRGHAVTVGILPYRTGNAEIARDRLPRRLQRLAMT